MKSTSLLSFLTAGATAQGSSLLSTITAAQTVVLPCTATPLPNDCLANGWSDTVVSFTKTPSYAMSLPDGLGTETETETERKTFYLTGLPTITRWIRPSSIGGTGMSVSTGGHTPTVEETGSARPEGSGSGNAGVGRRLGVAGAVVGVVAGLAAW